MYRHRRKCYFVPIYNIFYLLNELISFFKHLFLIENYYTLFQSINYYYDNKFFNTHWYIRVYP